MEENKEKKKNYKNLIIFILLLIFIGSGGYLLFGSKNELDNEYVSKGNKPTYSANDNPAGGNTAEIGKDNDEESLDLTGSPSEDVTPTNEPTKSEPTVEITEVITPTVNVSGTATASPTPEKKPVTVPTKTVTKAPAITLTKVPTKSPVNISGTPVSIHGKLSVSGTKLVDKNRKTFQLKGVSTHGIAWFPGYVNKAAFQNLRDDWGANTVRLAMYTHEYDGYLAGGNKAELEKIVTNGVQYATELGMYVIIDWHTLNGAGSNPFNTLPDAKLFWNKMSKKYASYNNVIYEICNEPNSGASWSSVKGYAEAVIKVIRANDPDAVILIGTPTWCQDVDQAAANPIKGQKNIMYTLHFYAGTHKQWLRDKMVAAINKGLPIFVSEFGITDASGNGKCDIKEANTWIKTLDSYNVSYICWNLANKNESSAMIKSGVSKTSGWTYNDLKEEGQWFVDVLRGRISQDKVGAYKSGTGENIVAPKPSLTPTKSPGSATPTPTKTPVATPTVKPVNKPESFSANGVTLKPENSWEGNCQYAISFQNSDGSPVDDWTIKIQFESAVSVNNGWNCSYSVENNNIIIKPASYNKYLPDGKLSDVGLIIHSEKGFKIKNVTITY